MVGAISRKVQIGHASLPLGDVPFQSGEVSVTTSKEDVLKELEWVREKHKIEPLIGRKVTVAILQGHGEICR